MGASYVRHVGHIDDYKPTSTEEKTVEEMVLRFNNEDWSMTPKAMLAYMEEIVDFLNTIEVSVEMEFSLYVLGEVDPSYGGPHEIIYAHQKWKVES